MIENYLSYYAWPAAGINDFSRFPIPFSCVAADILTDTKVDIKSGYLPDAIRASISIPSLFVPYKLGSALLVDGGIIRNFPAQEVKDMGADIVIGSYTGYRWQGENDLQDVSDIIKQITFSRSYKDFDEQKKLTDYLIMPDLRGLALSDFSKVDSIYKRGYKASLPFKQKFRRLADSLDRIGPQRIPPSILGLDSYIFDRIDIEGNNIYTDSQIMGVLDIEPGQSVSRQKLSDGIDLLYGKAWFEKIKYRVTPLNDSLTLTIECTEKPKAIFYGAVHYDDVTGAGTLLSLALKNTIFPGSVINIDGSLARYYRVNAMVLNYLDPNQKYSLSADFFSDNTLIPMLHLNSESGEMLSRNFITGLSLGRRMGLNHMLSISESIENLYLIPHYVSPAGINHILYNYLKTSFSYRINSLDNKHFPEKGTIFNLNANSSRLMSARIKTDLSRSVFRPGNQGRFFFGQHYSLSGNFRQYIPAGKKLTLSVHTDAAFVSGCDSVISANNYFWLGGIRSYSDRAIPMVGYHAFEFPVRGAAGGGIEFDFEILSNLHLNLMSDLFAIQEVYRKSGVSLMPGFGIGAGYMTVIGPLRVGLMYGSGSDSRVFNNLKGYISIGYSF